MNSDNQGAEKCAHTVATLVETRGLGGFNPIEVYACDKCGRRFDIRILHADEDWAAALAEDPR